MELTEQKIAEITAEAATKAVEAYKQEIVKRFSPGHVEVILDEADRPFRSFGEQTMAVKDFAMSAGRKFDVRLKLPTGMGEGQPSEGGFLVQTDFATQLLEKTFATSDLLSRITRYPLSGGANAIKIPAVSDASRADGSRWGGIRAYWAAEAAAKTASQAAFDQVALELKKLVGLCYVTDELLQDASFLEAWIRNAFVKEFDFKIGDAIINGDGAGKPLGILSAPCTYSITAETGQGSSTIVSENIIKMWSARFGPNSSNYVWLINQNIEPQLYTMGLAVGAGGGAVYMPVGGLSVAPYATLMGRPVIPCEFAAALGTVGDIILADLSQYIFIDKGGLQAASSIHYKFNVDESTFRFVYRCDGQPWWKTYITPYKGTTSYQSCFVTLATSRI